MTKCDFCDDGYYDNDDNHVNKPKCDHCNGTGECPLPNRCGCREWQD